MRDHVCDILYTAEDVPYNHTRVAKYFCSTRGSSNQRVRVFSWGRVRKALVNYAPFTPNTFGASPVDRPCQVQITDGSGTLFAEIDTYYDGGTTLCGADGSQAVMAVNGLPTSTHDTNYGVNAASRGNATTVSRKCLLNCTTSASTTTATYDETGQVVSDDRPVRDSLACGRHDRYEPHDNILLHEIVLSDANPAGNSNAYLTQIAITPTRAWLISKTISIAIILGDEPSRRTKTTS